VRYAAGIAAALACLYILSFAPAGRWVASALVGQAGTPADLARYDARFSGYRAFYGPLLEVRMRLIFAGILWPEKAHERYESLFALHSRLADGRRVFTTYASNSPQPGESSVDCISRLCGFSPTGTIPSLTDSATPELDLQTRENTAPFGAQTPLPGTEIHALPRSRRALVILAPNEDPFVELVLFPNWEPNLLRYAGLQNP
jgi:hypothetical protein